MALTKTHFYSGLYQEHLAESGVLLATAISYFFDFEISWCDVWELERRLDAHVDALEIGGTLARNTALKLLISDDEDELLGAAYALATISVDDIGLEAVFEAFVEADEEQLPCFVEAFKHGQHPRLADKLMFCLDHDNPIIRAASVEILGYRREADPKRVWPLLHDKDPMIQRAAILSLARSGFKEALPAAEQIILESADINDDYLLVLLMLGSERALDICRRSCSSAETVSPKQLLYLALAGTPADYNIVLNAKQYRDSTEAVIQSLGLFGNVAAIPHLYNALNIDDDNLNAEAGKALEMITGAGLREIIQVPEEEPEEIIPTDILGEDADEEQDAEEPDEPRMLEIERSSTSFDDWHAWWQKNEARFDPRLRWRKGKLFNLGACIDEIAEPNSSYDDRQRAYLELVIRSGEHIGFEADWFILRQMQAIKEWQSWWVLNQESLSASPW